MDQNGPFYQTSNRFGKCVRLILRALRDFVVFYNQFYLIYLDYTY